MKLDLHTHSSYSADGRIPPKEILKAAKARKLDGVSITDHNDVRAFADAKQSAQELGLILVRGCEISTSSGHIIAYGIDERIDRDLSPGETIERIKAAGGVSVVPHPYRMVSGVGGNVCKNLKPDAIETINGRSPNGDNSQAAKLAELMKLPCTGGSDAHDLESVGAAWTTFRNPMSGEDDVLDAIRKREIKAGGTGMTGGETAGFMIKSTAKWVKRGFKRV